MGARSFLVPVPLAFPLLFAFAAGCAQSDSVGDTFQNLGGSGGNGVGGGEGAAGAGVTTTSDTTPTTSSTTSSTTSGTTSTTSGTTSTTTPTSTCDDTGPEPNENEATAKNLGTIDDCDGSGDSFSGVLDGPDDVDWYRLGAEDSFGCTVDPTRTVQFMMPARLCKFVQCVSGEPSVTCPGNTTSATSPDGRKGCCGTTGFEVDIDCPGTDDDTTIYFRVDNPNAGACIPYTVEYHY